MSAKVGSALSTTGSALPCSTSRDMNGDDYGNVVRSKSPIQADPSSSKHMTESVVSLHGARGPFGRRSDLSSTTTPNDLNDMSAPKKFTPTRGTKDTATKDTDGRSSVMSTSSSGTSAGSSAFSKGSGFAPSKSQTAPIKSQVTEASNTRSKLATRSKPSRPASTLAVPRGKSPVPPSSPKKTRNATFSSPAGSPIKPTFLLPNSNEDADDTLGPNHLVDATIVSDFDLSGEFDVAELSRMLTDERERENELLSDDKVLVTVRCVLSLSSYASKAKFMQSETC